MARPPGEAFRTYVLLPGRTLAYNLTVAHGSLKEIYHGETQDNQMPEM